MYEIRSTSRKCHRLIIESSVHSDQALIESAQVFGFVTVQLFLWGGGGFIALVPWSATKFMS